MTGTDIEAEIDLAIQKRYHIDFNAIRNLSKLAEKLHEGWVIVPGNITILGKLTVGNNKNEGTITVVNRYGTKNI